MRQFPGPALLFCPADRPDRYAKALAAADAVVLDLEDAVAPHRKAAAREALLSHRVDPQRVVVRLNAAGPELDRDLETVRTAGFGTVMLPKCEAPPTGLDRLDVVALCETPLGILNAAAIAAGDVVALMWGAEDLLAAMGGRSSRFPDGRYRDYAVHARPPVLLAAKAHGRQAIDAVHLDHADHAGLAAEAEDAAASGFDLKACIHPGQVDVVRAAFRPPPERVEWARRVLAAARNGGVVSVEGQMVDAPLVRQAERVLRDRESPGQTD